MLLWDSVWNSFRNLSHSSPTGTPKRTRHQGMVIRKFCQIKHIDVKSLQALLESELEKQSAAGYLLCIRWRFAPGPEQARSYPLCGPHNSGECSQTGTTKRNTSRVRTEEPRLVDLLWPAARTTPARSSARASGAYLAHLAADCFDHLKLVCVNHLDLGLVTHKSRDANVRQRRPEFHVVGPKLPGGAPFLKRVPGI